jgi:hypothetical protein
MPNSIKSTHKLKRIKNIDKFIQEYQRIYQTTPREETNKETNILSYQIRKG